MAWLGRILAAALAAWVAGALPAAACAFVPGPLDAPSAGARPLAGLPEGIMRGHARCPGEAPRAIVVWTLAIDGDRAFVGVRDAPLFRPLPLNPMIDVTRVGYAGDAAFSVFVRADQAPVIADRPEGPDRRPPHRLFGTLCTLGASDPLDCDAPGGRVKARVDLADSDGDGVLDIARHEVSILAGDRLQVLRFILPHDPEPLALVAAWIGALEIAGFE